MLECQLPPEVSVDDLPSFARDDRHFALDVRKKATESSPSYSVSPGSSACAGAAPQY